MHDKSDFNNKEVHFQSKITTFNEQKKDCVKIRMYQNVFKQRDEETPDEAIQVVCIPDNHGIVGAEYFKFTRPEKNKG